jgi:hypothetical protein
MKPAIKEIGARSGQYPTRLVLGAWVRTKNRKFGLFGVRPFGLLSELGFENLFEIEV